MAINIEKQGLRKGYIAGGIFAILLAAVLVILYFPTFLQDLFNISPIWDLRTPITNLIGDNFLGMIDEWGVIAVLALFFLLYFICFSARPSTASTFFRLCCLFACLGIALPFVLVQVQSLLGEFDLTTYVNYAIMGLFVLCFIFWLIGLISRCVKKYHKNKPTTVLAFTATFWLILLGIFAFDALNATFSLGIDFTMISSILYSTPDFLSIIAVFLIIDAIWMFITVPNRVRVEYNTSTSSAGSNRPRVVDSTALNAAGAAATMTQQGKFAHNYTNTQNQNFNNNPVLNDSTTTQPLNAYPQRPANIRPTLQPATAPPPATPTRPAVQNPLNQYNTTPSQNNFASQPYQTAPRQNATPFGINNQPGQLRPAQTPFGQNQMPNNQNYNAPRPMPQQAPRPTPFNTQQPAQNPYARPTPAQQPRPAPYNTQPQQSRPPVTPFTQRPQPNQPRPAPYPNQQPYNTQPQQPRPPVTPFTGTNQPRPTQYPNQQNPNGVPPRPNNNNGTNGNNW